MKTAILNELKSSLQEANAIPSGIDYNTKLNIKDVRAINYEYYGNKYMESNECFNNHLVSILFEHSQIDKPFWINIFWGAQYRNEDVACVAATYCEQINKYDEICAVNGAIYKEDGIQEGENNIIEQIVFAFDCVFFNGDEAGLYDNGYGALFQDNTYVLEELADEIISIRNIEIDEKLSVIYPNESQIQEVGEKYLKAASGNLYYVSVVNYNKIETLYLNLKKEDADRTYVSLANEWYTFDGTFETIEDVQAYENSENYSENDYECNVSIETM